MRSRHIPAVFAIFLAVTAFCSGCATPRHQLPKDLMMKATVSDMAEVRTFVGSEDSPLQRSLVDAIVNEKSAEYPVGTDGTKEYPILAISGGSANGAYGAGLLKGWSQEGSRPKFKIVTGVSTGGITAPFAFLGKEYDAVIEELYTTMSTKDVMQLKRPLQGLLGNSLGSNKPLEKKIRSMVTDDILQKIAAEHKTGRRLYVGTTDLDAAQFVVWDMGAIAVRGDKKLFGEVLLASAAIPVIFPPVLITVQADGCRYDEMHVDGGTVTQAFTVYRLLDPFVEKAKARGIALPKMRAKCYIIRNGYIKGSYDTVKDSLPAIASRSSDTMINAQGVGDTYRIYTEMKQRGNDYNLAFIPSDFRPPKKEEFDPAQMKQLFDKGYEDAVGGYKWHKVPPGMEE